MQKVSAYIPVFNNAATLTAALNSLRAQTYTLDEILVIDDGSTDDSGRIAAAWGARLIRHEKNLGRGAARALAMSESRHEFVLCCDGTNALTPDFAKRALTYFSNPCVAGVFGRLTQPPARNVVERWRGRHLFRLCDTPIFDRKASLITFGTMVRRSTVLSSGNYNAALHHSEDRELGLRLLNAGFEVVYDPSLLIVSQAKNTLVQVLERYWRWHAGYSGQPQAIREYLRQIWYSIRVMAFKDLRQGDPLAAPISLASPHIQFFTSRFRRNHSRGGISRESKPLFSSEPAESAV